MIHNLASRIKKIEQKVGGNTIVIRSYADLVAIEDKRRRGIKVGKVTHSPEMEEWFNDLTNLAKKIKDKETEAGQNAIKSNGM